MREDEQAGRCRTMVGERRMLRAAIALGAAVALSAAGAPIAHAASAGPAPSSASSVSPLAAVTDPAAETAAVELLKATYFNDVDTKNWAALRQLFAPDAVVDTTGSLGPLFPNRDSFIVFTALTLSAINTRHQGYDPQIDLTSDTTASAVWTMQDRLSIAGLVTIHGYGHYADNYEKVNGQWLVTHSVLTRTGFTLEFPLIQRFVTGLSNAYRSGGPVAALRYVVPGLINIPVGAVNNLVGAIASNFGGPPAKADPISVPPGSSGVTTEPPGITSTAAVGTAPVKAAARLAPTAPKKASASRATPLGTVTAGAAKTPAHPIEPDAGKAAVDDSAQVAAAGPTAESPKTLANNASRPDATVDAKSATSTHRENRIKPTTASADKKAKADSTKVAHGKS